MQDRDERILKHIGLYRVSLRAVIEELFFEGESCDHVIQRLLRQKRIQVIGNGLPDNLSYYQLVERELRARGMPSHRADPRGNRLDEDLAVLWFCCMGPKRRPRIDRKDVNLRFGRGPGMGSSHCREKLSDGIQIVYRLRLVGPDTDNGRLLRELQFAIESSLSHATLGPFVMERLYKFAVLVQDPDRLERLAELVDKRDSLKRLVHLEEVPGTLRLAAAIRDRKAKRQVASQSQ